MTASRIRSILACLVVPLCGFSCMAFRDFQVRPYLSDPSRGSVSLATLAEDYAKVADAVKDWAAERGLEQVPCRYYSRPTESKAPSVQGSSPACQVFEGNEDNPYSVRTEFAPTSNSTRVSVYSATHSAVEQAARSLRAYLASKLGPASISDYGGGEIPQRGVEPKR